MGPQTLQALRLNQPIGLIQRLGIGEARGIELKPSSHEARTSNSCNGYIDTTRLDQPFAYRLRCISIKSIAIDIVIVVVIVIVIVVIVVVVIIIIIITTIIISIIIISIIVVAIAIVTVNVAIYSSRLIITVHRGRHGVLPCEPRG